MAFPTATSRSRWHLIARNDGNTLDTVQSKLRVKLFTCADAAIPDDPESGKPISDERVISLLPDGAIRSNKTGADGIVEFEFPLLAPSSPVFVVFPDILERWSDDSAEQQVLSHLPSPNLKTSSSANKPDTLQSDTSLLFIALEAYIGMGKDQIDALADSTHNDLPYRSKDLSKHRLLTQSVDSNDTVTINMDKLIEEEKFQHIYGAYLAIGAHFVSQHGNFNRSRRRFEGRGGGFSCNPHGDFFLGFWFNYNNRFRGATNDFRQLLTHSCANAQIGFSEFLDAVRPPANVYVHAGLDFFLPGLYFDKVDGATTVAGDALVRQLRNFNVYAIGDITWLLANGHHNHQREDPAVLRAQQDVQQWQHGLPANDPRRDEDDFWQIIWDLDGRNPIDNRLLTTLDRTVDVNYDHHGGILVLRASGEWTQPPPRGGDVDLVAFSADSGQPIVMRAFADQVTGRSARFVHFAFSSLKSLRPGGFAPAGAGARADEISRNPPRFVYLTP